MTQYRTEEQVKKFDIFKVVTFGILVLLLLFSFRLVGPAQNPPAIAQATTEPTTAAPATAEPAEATEAEPDAAPAPATPTLNSPGEATAGEVMLTGTGQPGSEVEIVVDGKGVGKTTVGSDGKWTFAAELSKPGEYQISVQSVDADGKVLAASEAVALIVAAAEAPPSAATEEAPAVEPAPTTEAATPIEVIAPTLDSPGEIAAGEVTLTGTGEPGSKVEIVVDGKVVGQATVGSDGKWSFAADLSKAGEYQVGVQSVDADGKVLAASEIVALTVTEAAEPAAVAEVAAPTLDPPDATVAGEVTLTGTGEPGSAVEIVVDGKVVGQATVGSDGKWSFTTDLPKTGEYEVSVQSLDADGKMVTASEAVALTVTAAEAAESAATVEPAATKAATASAEVTAPTLDPLDEVAAGEVTLTGTGEPGSDVEIVVDGEVVGQATVSSDGAWSFVTDLPKAGEYEVSVHSVDADGQVLAASEAVALRVTAAGAPPAASATAEAAEPSATAEATATEEATATAEVTAPTLDQPGGVKAGEVTLTGTGEPGSEVEIVVDGQVVGQATVGRDGKWTFPADLSKAGDYKISVQGVDKDGTPVAAAEEISIEVAAAETSEAAAPEEEGGQAYIVQADDWLSKLALKFYSDMTKYPTIVEATNAKAQMDNTFAIITNPDLIEIGQKLWIPVEAP